MHTVHYTKHFISGNLSGMAVKCQLRVPDAAAALRLLGQLAKATELVPMTDCGTGARYWVSY